MAPYSMDLRKRVLRAWDAGLDAKSVAAKYEVSRAWVHRLVQRRRETGSMGAPEANQVSAARVGRPGGAAEGADRRAPRRDADRIAGGPADVGGVEHDVAGHRTLEFDGQKKRYTPTNNAALTSRRPAVSGSRGSLCAMRASTCFSTNPASPPTCCAGMAEVRAARGWRDHTPCSHWQTHTVIATLGVDGVCASGVFDGPIDNESFLAYVEQILVPTLRPGAVVVLDNLAVHKQAEVRAAIERVGASLRFLPPYSPDFNPIELAFPN